MKHLSLYINRLLAFLCLVMPAGMYAQIAVFSIDTITVCKGMPVELVAPMSGLPAGAQVVWSNGNTNPSITVSREGWMYSTVTSSQGIRHDSIYINHGTPQQQDNVIGVFGARFDQDSAFVCTNNQANLYVLPNNAVMYHVWTSPGGTTTTSAQASLLSQGWYHLLQTDFRVCLVDDSVYNMPTSPLVHSLPEVIGNCDSVDFALVLNNRPFNSVFPIWQSHASGVSDTLLIQPNYLFGESGLFIFSAFDGLNSCLFLDTVEVYVGPMQNEVSTLPDYGSDDGLVYLDTHAGWGGTSPLAFDWDSSGVFVARDSLTGLEQGSYTLYIQDVQGCLDTVHYSINYEIGVFPGDSDHDGEVDMQDIFPLGLFYQSTGPARSNPSLAWGGQQAPLWNTSMLNGFDIRHADADGNGQINSADTLGITQNYRSIHTNFKTGGNGPLLTFQMPQTVSAGDTLRIPVMLGDSSMMVTNAYGIAFNVVYDTAIIVENSVWIDWTNSWLGNKGSDMIALSQDFYDHSQVDAGMVRNDFISRAGYGRICDVIVVTDDHIGKRFLPLRLDFSDIRGIDHYGKDIELEGVPGIVDPTTSILPEWEADLRMYPNPTKSSFYLEHTTLLSGEISIYDPRGSVVITQPLKQGLTPISLKDYAPGIYMIMIQSGEQRVYKKIMLQP